MCALMVQVLVTIPVHNEARLLRETVMRVRKSLLDSDLDFQLSVAEDGSTDGTKAILGSLASEIPELLVQSLPERAGRGKALRLLWSAQPADVYAFCDADLAADPEALIKVIQACRSGADVATGSRYVENAVVHRPPARRMASEGYNALVRWIFDVTTRDHQCGLKAFRQEALRQVLPLCREDSWVWDTEVMVLAAHQGLEIREVPVTWTERRGSRTPWLRLASDVRLHGTALVRLKGDLRARLLQEIPNPTATSSNGTIQVQSPVLEPPGSTG
jgi:glycosyltransferase AglD